jgi:hypothetical protein
MYLPDERNSFVVSGKLTSAMFPSSGRPGGPGIGIGLAIPMKSDRRLKQDRSST